MGSDHRRAPRPSLSSRSIDLLRSIHDLSSCNDVAAARLRSLLLSPSLRALRSLRGRSDPGTWTMWVSTWPGWMLCSLSKRIRRARCIEDLDRCRSESRACCRTLARGSEVHLGSISRGDDRLPPRLRRPPRRLKVMKIVTRCITHCRLQGRDCSESAASPRKPPFARAKMRHAEPS